VRKSSHQRTRRAQVAGCRSCRLPSERGTSTPQRAAAGNRGQPCRWSAPDGAGGKGRQHCEGGGLRLLGRHEPRRPRACRRPQRWRLCIVQGRRWQVGASQSAWEGRRCPEVCRVSGSYARRRAVLKHCCSGANTGLPHAPDIAMQKQVCLMEIRESVPDVRTCACVSSCGPRELGAGAASHADAGSPRPASKSASCCAIERSPTCWHAAPEIQAVWKGLCVPAARRQPRHDCKTLFYKILFSLPPAATRQQQQRPWRPCLSHSRFLNP